MYIGKVFKLIILSFIFSLISACSIYESIYGYSESQVITLNNPVELTKVFLCSESSAIELNRNNSWWSRKITFKDVDLGLIETGYFSKSNIAGIRFRVTYHESERNFTLDLKANGPYYIDLGVKQAFGSLKAKLVGCLST